MEFTAVNLKECFSKITNDGDELLEYTIQATIPDDEDKHQSIIPILLIIRNFCLIRLGELGVPADIISEAENRAETTIKEEKNNKKVKH